MNVVIMKIVTQTHWTNEYYTAVNIITTIACALPVLLHGPQLVVIHPC